jgi:hypothetical protein
MITELIAAEGTDPVIKRAGLESLSLYHAHGFPDVALKILNNAQETPTVRQAAARYAMRFLNRGTADEKEKYALPYGESIKRLLQSNAESLQPIQKELRTIQSSLYRQFPQVEERLK